MIGENSQTRQKNRQKIGRGVNVQGAMNRENRQIVTDEPDEFEK